MPTESWKMQLQGISRDHLIHFFLLKYNNFNLDFENLALGEVVLYKKQAH